LDEIILRIDYDENSYRRVGELLDLFPEKGRSRMKVFFKDIFGAYNKVEQEGVAILDSFCFKAEAPNINIELSKEAIKKGYQVERVAKYYKTEYCSNDRYDHFEVDPEGEIMMCNVARGKFPPLGKISPEGFVVRE